MNKITTTISMMAVIFFVSMPSHVSARSPIDDYFDELDAYDARMAEHKAQEPVVTSPLSFFNYSSQGVKQVEAAELVVTSNAPKVVSSDNEKSVNRSVATVSKKDEGEVIWYNNVNDSQASVFNTGRSTSLLNSGVLLIFLMVVLIIMILVKTKKRKNEMMTHRRVVHSDGFHDMDRYQPVR